MNPRPNRTPARTLAAAHIASGDPLGWFDLLYRQAGREADKIPWADRKPNLALTEWIAKSAPSPQRALVVGCGLGDDAEFLASLGWSATAFDISPEAIQWAQKRFPNSKVNYRAADLFAPPPQWNRAFDLVVEIYTLQVLTPPLRQRAIPLIAEWVSPGGLLFIGARAREESGDLGSMPWPLTEREVREFEKSQLQCRLFEDYLDHEQPPVRRFRAVFSRELSDGDIRAIPVNSF